MTKDEINQLVNLILAYGEATSRATLAFHVGDSTISNSKSVDALFDFVYNLEDKEY